MALHQNPPTPPTTLVSRHWRSKVSSTDKHSSPGWHPGHGPEGLSTQPQRDSVEKARRREVGRDGDSGGEWHLIQGQPLYVVCGSFGSWAAAKERHASLQEDESAA